MSPLNTAFYPSILALTHLTSDDRPPSTGNAVALTWLVSAEARKSAAAARERAGAGACTAAVAMSNVGVFVTSSPPCSTTINLLALIRVTMFQARPMLWVIFPKNIIYSDYAEFHDLM